MKLTNKIIFTILLCLMSYNISAQTPVNTSPLNGVSFVKAYLNPTTHDMMIGYSLGIINGFNMGLSYEGKHIACKVPAKFRMIDVGNAVVIAIVSNKYLQKKYVNIAILEGFALSFCKKVGEQT